MGVVLHENKIKPESKKKEINWKNDIKAFKKIPKMEEITLRITLILKSTEVHTQTCVRMLTLKHRHRQKKASSWTVQPVKRKRTSSICIESGNWVARDALEANIQMTKEGGIERASVGNTFDRRIAQTWRAWKNARDEQHTFLQLHMHAKTQNPRILEAIPHCRAEQ